MSPPSSSPLKGNTPAKKKAKTDNGGNNQSIKSFFASSSSKELSDDGENKNINNDINNNSNIATDVEIKTTTTTPTSVITNIEEKNQDNNDKTGEPIIPKTISSSSGATYQSLHDNFVLVRKPKKKREESPRTSVAAFDLDGTLLKWINDSPGFWPSKLEHYELWNDTVITKMRQLYDEENHLLVIFTNQGGIQGAHSGKKATVLKSILDWMEHIIERPIAVIASTKSMKKHGEKSFHKPTSNMWKKIFIPYFSNKNHPFSVSNSFYVGDSADEETDPQGGVDKKFANSVGLKFYEPYEYFGSSNQEIRQRCATVGESGEIPVTPASALEARNALMGGYYSLFSQGNPILLLLCGVQGSGKSTFSNYVLNGDEKNSSSTESEWVWLSQDTINNGKPGKREKVTKAARESILEGKSVIIDRMHLDPSQRQTTIEEIMTDEIKDSRFKDVNIHVVLFNPPKNLITHRVKTRTNHPAKVEGEKGVKIALMMLNKLDIPTYKEDNLGLISAVSTEYTSKQLALRYHHAIATTTDTKLSMEKPTSTPATKEASTLSIPTISLGTQKIGRRKGTEIVQSMISAGFKSIDTAPTYNNEDKVGEVLKGIENDDIFIIAKVPKRATNSDQVIEEFEKTLANLNRTSVDLLLLHWPCDVIVMNTLEKVWKTMESFVKDGRCKALGVCNFNEAALAKLLMGCSIPPIINQVERHPLLPNHSLVDFCARNNICIQAHTALGQGREEILQHPTVVMIAKEAECTPAQVLVQWNIQHGVLVATKCTQDVHAKEILSTIGSSPISLSPMHMKELDSMGNGTRLIAPSFMYGSSAIYYWGARVPARLK